MSITKTVRPARRRLGVRLVQVGLVAGVATAPWLIVPDLADALTRPGYSVVRHWVSHRALGELGWVGTLSLLTTAVALGMNAAALVALRRTSRVRSWYPGVLAGAAAGLLLAALFPMDPSLGFPPGAEPGSPTTSGLLHDIGGPVFILGLAMAAFLTRTLFRRLNAPARWTGLGRVAGVGVLVAFVTTSVLVTLDYSGVVPFAWSGFFERLAIYLGLVWNSAVSARLLRVTVGQVNGSRTAGPGP